MAADREFPFEVRETAGIRRRNDVITISATESEVVNHTGGYRILLDSEPVPAQFRRVEWPGEPPELVADFIGHFQPLEAQRYVLQLTDEPTSGEPEEGLTLTETDDEYQIDSSGLVFWTIRKDLRGLLNFAWKGVDYIKDGSSGLILANGDGVWKLSDRPPARAAVERAGPLCIGLRFDYDDWPEGTKSTVSLEFPQTKSWIHATWSVDGDLSSLRQLGAELNLQLDGPEALLDFGAGDFVYTTVTRKETVVCRGGPRDRAHVPWTVERYSHAQGGWQDIVTAPDDLPTLKVPGWAHVMDDKRCTALAIADFGETSMDRIDINGEGRLRWSRDRLDEHLRAGVQQLEFWLHFVTMPVHIGARTSPRSMQEPLVIRWLDE